MENQNHENNPGKPSDVCWRLQGRREGREGVMYCEVINIILQPK